MSLIAAMAGTMGGLSPITSTGSWINLSGATSPTRTLTVPAGNVGDLLFDITSLSAGSAQYSKNGGAWTTFSDNAVVNFANGDTLAFRISGGGPGDVLVGQIKDNTFGTNVNGVANNLDCEIP